MDIISALQKTTVKIKSWVQEQLDNVGMGLEIVDDKLYLRNNNGLIEDSGVELPAGGGGGSSSAYIKLTNKLSSNVLTVAVGSDVNLIFDYASSEHDGFGTAYIYIGGNLKGTETIATGENIVNISRYVGEGANEVKITCMDVYSNRKSLSYTVNVVALRITSTFDDGQIYSGDINVRYTPYGAVEKTMHFVVDGKDNTVVVSETGKQRTYTISAMEHGSHSLKIYATAAVNGVDIVSNELNFDIMSVVDSATVPIIGSSYSVKSVTQGELISIPFSVYDPVNLETEIVLKVIHNGDVYSTSARTVDRTRQIWNTRDYPVGLVTFNIAYGAISKSHTISVVENKIDVSIKETDLEFQLKAAGKSNNDNDRDSWTSGNITTIFDYVNWESTGWIEDENGDTALRLSGDAKAIINFNPFSSDARQSGRTIEMEFAIRNVNNRDAVAISCLSGGIGFTVTADTAKLKSEQTEVACNYTDEEKIRIAFVIEPRTEHRMMSVYLNGVLSKTEQYPETDNMQQNPVVNITVGSPYCSVDLYTIRSYNTALTDAEVRDNYIADITDIGERSALFADNDIYDDFGALSFAALKEKIPVLVITGSLPTYKGDKRQCVVTYTDPLNTSLDFENSATIDIQGTSSQYYPRKNWKIKTSEPQILDLNQIATKVLCWKVDFAESTGTHNTGHANYVHTLYRDTKTPPQKVDSRVRTTIYGRPCVIFHKEDNLSEPVFYGKANANIDKGGLEVFGFTDEYPEAQCVEFCNNVSDACLFHGSIPEKWSDDFEFRQPDGYEDISAFKIMHDWVVSTWQDGATGSMLADIYAGADGETYLYDTSEYRLAKFKKEFTNYFKLDFCLIYYIYTFVMEMVDQRAKNMFLATWDKVHWEPWLYDNDIDLSL